MNFFSLYLSDVPGIGKYKAYIAGAVLMLGGVSGLFHGIGDIAGVSGHFLGGDLTILDFVNQVSVAAQQTWEFFLGLGVIGVRHGQAKTTGI